MDGVPDKKCGVAQGERNTGKFRAGHVLRSCKFSLPKSKQSFQLLNGKILACSLCWDFHDLSHCPEVPCKLYITMLKSLLGFQLLFVSVRWLKELPAEGIQLLYLLGLPNSSAGSSVIQLQRQESVLSAGRQQQLATFPACMPTDLLEKLAEKIANDDHCLYV